MVFNDDTTPEINYLQAWRYQICMNPIFFGRIIDAASGRLED